MSGKRVKSERRWQRLHYVRIMCDWLAEEPPMRKFIAWLRWKSQRPLLRYRNERRAVMKHGQGRRGARNVREENRNE